MIGIWGFGRLYQTLQSAFYFFGYEVGVKKTNHFYELIYHGLGNMGLGTRACFALGGGGLMIVFMFLHILQ